MAALTFLVRPRGRAERQDAHRRRRTQQQRGP
jgi:hypothetical protein